MALLQFDNVTVEDEHPYDVGLENVDFRLNAGELLVINLDRRYPLADTAQGLVEPVGGSVEFADKKWSELGPDKAAAARGRIGRVFDGYGWVSNLDVDENITLAQRFHTTRPLRDIRDEAESLGRSFGFTELPELRPALAKRPDLKRAEWVRAFLGKPLLVILEKPMAGIDREMLPRLLAACDNARSHGAGVLWLTDGIRHWPEVTGKADSVFEMKGPQLIQL